MSQAAAKATRRDIRRAFGPDAIQTLQDHHEAIVKLWAALHTTQADVKAADVMIDSLRRSSYADLREVHSSCHGFRTRGFWSRLNWLLTGR